jgi:hypothetical protein
MGWSPSPAGFFFIFGLPPAASSLAACRLHVRPTSESSSGQREHRQRPCEDSSMSKKPVHVVRFGLIKASVWHSRTGTNAKYSVTVVRLFKNGDTWNQSPRFGPGDLPVVRLALDEAHTWVLQRIQQQRASSREDVASMAKCAGDASRGKHR